MTRCVIMICVAAAVIFMGSGSSAETPLLCDLLQPGFNEVCTRECRQNHGTGTGTCQSCGLRPCCVCTGPAPAEYVSPCIANPNEAEFPCLCNNSNAIFDNPACDLDCQVVHGSAGGSCDPTLKPVCNCDTFSG